AASTMCELHPGVFFFLILPRPPYTSSCVTVIGGGRAKNREEGARCCDAASTHAAALLGVLLKQRSPSFSSSLGICACVFLLSRCFRSNLS
uniref:Uncharacterized protein n=1 Tax=Hippocampus comes TaxID=109280 RepID=A0A3Q3E3Y3_HIPCM